MKLHLVVEFFPREQFVRERNEKRISLHVLELGTICKAE